MAVSYQFSQSTNQIIRVATSVLQFIGILLSLFRLWFRLWIRRLWWEDAWALVACVCAIALLIAEWIYLEGEWVVSVVGFWLYSLVLTWVVWAVRMSILFSIARIVYPTEYMRRIVIVFATFFSLISLVLTALKLWWYTHNLIWLKSTSFYALPAHWLSYPMYIFELSTDCASDAILILFPMRLLWSMKLPEAQRRMIIAIFSSSIVVTMVSIFRGLSQLGNLRSLVGVATDIEVACSIIVCNLLVIVTLVYRFARRTRSRQNVLEYDPDDDDFTTPVSDSITSVLTTVHFSDPYHSENSSQECPSDGGTSLPHLEP